MKDQNNNAPLNFNILGIGVPSTPSIEMLQEKVLSTKHMLTDDSPVSMMFPQPQGSFHGKITNVRDGVNHIEDTAAWWLDEPTRVDAGVTMSNIRDSEYIIMPISVDELQLDKIPLAISTFSRKLTTNLVENAIGMGLSTDKLFDAGLAVAINLSLLKLMHITTGDDGIPHFPNSAWLADNFGNYEFFENMIRDPDLNIASINEKYRDEIDGIDEEWEDILNQAIADKTTLTADDSIIITEALAESWCWYDSNWASRDEDDVEVDEEDDDNDRMAVSVVIESEDDDCDCITVTGTDDRTITFFVDLAEVTSISDHFQSVGPNFEWDWLRHLLPVSIVRTTDSGRYLACNEQHLEMRFITLGEAADGVKVLGLYVIDDECFDDDNHPVELLNYLFATYIAGKPMSQEKRILNLEKLYLTEKDMDSLLMNNGLELPVPAITVGGMVQSFDVVKSNNISHDATIDHAQSSLKVGELDHSDDIGSLQVPEPEDVETVTVIMPDRKISDQDLTDIGCEIAETLREEPDTATPMTEFPEYEPDLIGSTETDPSRDRGRDVEAAGDLIFKPIRKRKDIEHDRDYDRSR